MHKTIFTWFGNLPTSTELRGFHYYQGKYNSAQETLSRNPNPNYTLVLSHIKNKNRSWLPLSSLFSLMRLLTRLIGISLYFHPTDSFTSTLLNILCKTRKWKQFKPGSPRTSSPPLVSIVNPLSQLI